MLESRTSELRVNEYTAKMTCPRAVVLLPKNLVTGVAEARIVSRPTRTGRAPLEGDYLKPRLSRGFFMTGPNHAQHGGPNVRIVITTRRPVPTGRPL